MSGSDDDDNDNQHPIATLKNVQIPNKLSYFGYNLIFNKQNDKIIMILYEKSIFLLNLNKQHFKEYKNVCINYIFIYLILN